MVREHDFKRAVRQAWEQIAVDCGSVDGEGAMDHLEQIFFTLDGSNLIDEETQRDVRRFDPELKKWALEALKDYG